MNNDDARLFQTSIYCKVSLLFYKNIILHCEDCCKHYQGWIQDFYCGGGGGGGAQMIMCAPTLRAWSPKSLMALRVFDALLCYLSHIFKHSDTKWDFINIVDQILGGGVPVAPPSKSATDSKDFVRLDGKKGGVWSMVHVCPIGWAVIQISLNLGNVCLKNFGEKEMKPTW